jgi:hypothetical protein
VKLNLDLPETDAGKQKAYKLRHKPTGLYYRPGNGFKGNSNLSKRGKLYSQKPSFSWVRQWRDLDGKVKNGDPEDWEIVVFNA